MSSPSIQPPSKAATAENLKLQKFDDLTTTLKKQWAHLKEEHLKKNEHMKDSRGSYTVFKITEFAQRYDIEESSILIDMNLQRISYRFHDIPSSWEGITSVSTIKIEPTNTKVENFIVKFLLNELTFDDVIINETHCTRTSRLWDFQKLKI